MADNAKVKGLELGSILLRALAQNWWLLLLRGLAGILFGILAIAWPGATVVSLVMLFSIYVVADGIFAIVAAIRGEGGPMPRWWLAVVGLLGIGVGILTFSSPGVTALTLLALIGAWALVRGIFEIVGAIRLRKEIDNEWTLILSGALSVLFGAFILVRPGAGALALIWVIGFYAILAGIMMVGFAFRLKRHMA
jgi:uncharacterized membrane protein HdeD (DUF308 family)